MKEVDWTPIEVDWNIPEIDWTIPEIDWTLLDTFSTKKEESKSDESDTIKKAKSQQNSTL